MVGGSGGGGGDGEWWWRAQAGGGGGKGGATLAAVAAADDGDSDAAAAVATRWQPLVGMRHGASRHLGSSLLRHVACLACAVSSLWVLLRVGRARAPYYINRTVSAPFAAVHA